ncbi:MAG: glycosyltransferase family 2 protein [Anaerolineae bacterium]|nr:glycosyltransferase family 2 protein [Anaerolineae bacterium]
MLDLAIVIVNYNTCDLLRDCLNSIYRSEGTLSYKVIVVDNASPDDSAAMVSNEFPTTELIVSQENKGFAYANNLGLRQAGFESGASSITEKARYALLLNPDTILSTTALADMVAFMDQNPAVGAAGPKLVRLDGSLDLACRRSFPTPEVSFYRMIGFSKLFPKSRLFGRYNMTYVDPDKLLEVDSVVGAFMMVRREAIVQAGLLDETYFMYGEDIDWAYKIKENGWKIFYNPAVTVTHIKRAASKHSPKAKVEFYRAMDIFYRKFYADNTPFWLHGLVITGINLPWRMYQLWYQFSAAGIEKKKTSEMQS